MVESDAYQSLASYQNCIQRIDEAWPQFLSARADRLRHGNESEKVAEAILEDLLTGVLDWAKGDLAYQVGYADIVLSRNIAKFLVIEVKRPGTLWQGRKSLDDAVQQARRYADEQKISRIAASDGRYLYAADIINGGLKDRVLVDLAHDVPSAPALWWLSVHGIYRDCADAVRPVVPDERLAEIPPDVSSELLHPKHHLPARCFAYTGDASKPSTWKLPYLLADGGPDGKRLPKAIQALLSNYRGTKVDGIPEQAIGDVLLRLAHAAAAAGRMPPQAVNPARVYQELAHILEQQGLKV